MRHSYRLLIRAGVVFVLGGLGCASPGTRASAPAPSELYDLAKQNYLSANYVGAAATATQYLAQSPNGKSALEARRIRAQASLYLQQCDQADEDFTFIHDKATGACLKSYAALGLAHTAFARGKYAEAIEHYREALKQEERDDSMCLHSVRDEVHFGMGVCLQNIGQWDKAEDHLYQVWHKFPKSKWVEHAGRRVFCDSFSVQIGAYRNYGHAEQQLQTAKARGLDARIEARQRSGNQVFAVLVGKLPDLGKASDAKRQVALKLGRSERSLAISTARMNPR